jgi:hypothetical protein
MVIIIIIALQPFVGLALLYKLSPAIPLFYFCFPITPTHMLLKSFFTPSIHLILGLPFFLFPSGFTIINLSVWWNGDWQEKTEGT